MAIVVLLFVGVMVHAQAGGATLPSSSETRQTAQQFLSQAKTNSSQFESTLADLTARNVSNKDLEAFTRLRNEINQLESLINNEQARANNTLQGGSRFDGELLNRIQRLIDQHKAKIAELEAFVSN
jgi:FMN-dependent NADH-azoreductase